MDKYTKLLIFVLATLLVVQNYMNWSLTKRDHYNVYQVWLDEDLVQNRSVPIRLNISDPVFLLMQSKSVRGHVVRKEQSTSHRTISSDLSLRKNNTGDTKQTKSSTQGTLLRTFSQTSKELSNNTSATMSTGIGVLNEVTQVHPLSELTFTQTEDASIKETTKIPSLESEVPRAIHIPIPATWQRRKLPEALFLIGPGNRGNTMPGASQANILKSKSGMMAAKGHGISRIHKFMKRKAKLSPVRSRNTALSMLLKGDKPPSPKHPVVYPLVSIIRRLQKNNDRSKQEIASLENRLNHTINSMVTPTPPCPSIPPSLIGRIHPEMSAASLEWVEKLHPELEPGGRWRPKTCVSNHRVAIIIPYRNRLNQLIVFLRHIHPFLQKQQLDYAIFVVELANPTKFNRGLLMNVGFEEARRLYNYQCYIFHDVDLLPEDDRNIYSCPGKDSPRHLSVAISTLHYRLPYGDIFGGASAVTTEQFFKVNGFPNRYFGWGAEDDDFSRRLRNNGYQISRYPAEVARYKMLDHKKQRRNPERFKLLDENQRNWRFDGLSSLKYSLVKLEFKKLYTWVFVSVDEQEIMHLGQPRSWKKT